MYLNLSVKKNNYKFLIGFIDDCDCEPGILQIKKLRQINPEIKLNMYCDMYCQNTSKTHLNDFLALLEHSDYDNYINSKFGHLLKLPELFNKHGIVTNCDKDNLIPKGNVSLQDIRSDKLHFSIEILFENDKCCIMVNENHEGDYVLYICNTLEQYNATTKNHKLEYYTDYASHYFEHKVVYKYNSTKDFPGLLEQIKKYFNLKNNTYGYYENNKYYNEKDIIAEFRLFENSNKYKEEIKNNYEFNIYWYKSPALSL